MDPNYDSSSLLDGDEVPGPNKEELDAMFAELRESLSEIEKERKERELAKWLSEWKVLTDAGEAWLRELGYTNETVHAECFEEVMSGEEVGSDVDIVQLPDEATEEDEDEDEDEGRADDGGFGGGGGGYGGGGGVSGCGGSGGGSTTGG